MKRLIPHAVTGNIFSLIIFLTLANCSNVRQKEAAEPLLFVKITYIPWEPGLPTTIPIELQNTATKTDYFNTGLLITYFDKNGRKLGTDRKRYAEVIKAGEKANIEVVISPNLYPLKTTALVKLKVEWTTPLTL